MIPQETIERIRESVDLVALVGEHVKLRRMGGDWRGPCPFHGGKNPNFSVSTRRNFYHCFKCGESGDAFSFLQKHLGMDWPTAVRTAAARVGIEVVETRGRRDGEQKDPREPLWALLGTAVQLFRDALAGDAGAEARQYLAGRALDEAACERFAIGFAPPDPNWLRDKCRALGYTDAQLLEAGLLVQREGETTLRPRFRNRVIFPIHDAAGHPVGFGGRLMGPGEPKYLNSSDSAHFHKGELLYGLHWAKQAMRKDERALVVEGYMDVIRCHLAGVTHAVAGLGTALTEQQAALLVRYTPNVWLLYDSDEAGQKATFKAGRELLRQRAAVRVVTLPEGEDPDTYLVAHGRAGLERAMKESLDLFERQLQLLERRGWFSDLSRARRAMDKLMPTLRATTDGMTRALYVSHLARVSGVDAATIERELAVPEAPRRQAMRAAPVAGDDPGPVGPPPDDWGPPPELDGPPGPAALASPPPPPLDQPKWKGKWRGRPQVPGWRAETAPPAVRRGMLAPGPDVNLVALLLQDRTWLASAEQSVDPRFLADPRLRAIFETLRQLGSQASLDEIELALTEAAPFALDALHELVEGAPDLVPDAGREAHFAGIVMQLRLRGLDALLRQLQQELDAADPRDEAALAALRAEHAALVAERRQLRASRFGKATGG